MSIEICKTCDQKIDTDFHAEHFEECRADAEEAVAEQEAMVSQAALENEARAEGEFNAGRGQEEPVNQFIPEENCNEDLSKK